MESKLLSRKPSLVSRRNVIIYIVLTILILGVVAGFTNTFSSDNRRLSTSWGDTIVIEKAPPTEGTPSDYNLLDNLKFAAYRIHHSSYFKGFTNGKVVADLGIGSYTQYLTNTRVVYGENVVFAETISSSSLVSVAEQKYMDNGIIIFRPSTSINGNKATYSSKAVQMSYSDFSEKYGSVPNQLSKYVINEQTILSVKDENAVKQPARNAAAGTDNDDSGIGFEVPEKLVPDADGNYTFTLTLDAKASSIYYRNEVRTLGGADENPDFHSVQITVTIDENWYPISTRTLENYDINIPVLGAMNCSGDNFEVFSDIDNEYGEIPEKDFFQPYVDEAKSKPGYEPPDIILDRPLSASDYLASAFADYISGEKSLDLSVNITAGDLSAHDLKLSLNLDTMDMQAMLGSGLYIKYSGDKVNIKLNNINGYMSVSDFDRLMQDERIADMLGGMGALDLTEIFGGDMLDVIFKDCVMTTENGITSIPMSFGMDLSSLMPQLGEAQIDAAILINDNDKSLISIIGDVTVSGTTVHVEVLPLKTTPKFPSTDGAVDLSGLLDFIPDILSTAEQTAYGINGTVTYDGMTFDVDAYIDRTDGIKADAAITVFGIGINVKYIDDIIYIQIGDTVVRGTTEELPDLMNALSGTVDMSIFTRLLDMIMPSSINDIAGMLNSLAITDDTLDVGLKMLTVPINIRLTRGGGKLTGMAFDMNINMFGIKLSAAAELNLTSPAPRVVTAPQCAEYITFAQLSDLIADIKPYLQAENNLTVTLDGYAEIDGNRQSIDGYIAIDKQLAADKTVIATAAKGAVFALGQTLDITYIDGTAYIGIGGIKTKLDVTDTDSLVDSLKLLLEQFFDIDGLTDNAEIADSVKTLALSIAADGTLNAEISVSGYTLVISFNAKTSAAKVSVKGSGITAVIDANISVTSQSRNIATPADCDRYIDVNVLIPTINAATEIVKANSVTANAAITVNGNAYSAVITAEFGDVVKAKITESTLGLEIVIIGDKAYVALGEVRLSGALAELQDMLTAIDINFGLQISDLTAALPIGSDIAGILSAALGAIGTPEYSNGTIIINVSTADFIGLVKAATDLSVITVDTTVNGAEINSALNISAGCAKITVPSGEFNSISEFTAMIPTLAAFANTAAIKADYTGSVDFDGDVYSIESGSTALIDVKNGGANAAINALGQTVNITYANNTAYIEIGNIKLMLDISDTDSIMPSVQMLLAKLGVQLPNTDHIKNQLTGIVSGINANDILTAINSISAFSVTNGVITLSVEYGGHTATLKLLPASNNCNDEIAITLTADIYGMAVGFNATLKTSENAFAPVINADEYIDIAELAPALDAAAAILGEQGVTAYATVKLGDMALTAKIEAEYAGGDLRLHITEDTLALDMAVIGGTAYITVGGIKVSGTLDDLAALQDSILPNLPDNIRPYVQKMADQMFDLIPSSDEINSNGKTDIAAILDLALSAIKELSLNGGMLNIGIAHKGLTARFNITPALTIVDGNIALSFTNIGGPFGDEYNINIDLNVTAITAKRVTVNSVEVNEYVPAATAISALNYVMPLVKESAFNVSFDMTAFGYEITGNAYIDLGDYTLQSLAARLSVNVAGVDVVITLSNKTLYADINNGSIRLSLPLGKTALKELIAELDEALPDLGLAEKLGSVSSIDFGALDISAMLGKVSLSPISNGMRLDLALAASPITIDIYTADDMLSAVDIFFTYSGEKSVIRMTATTSENGARTLRTYNAALLGIDCGFGITISPAERHDIDIPGEYVSPRALIPYIKPMLDLIDQATSAKVLNLIIDDMTINVLGKYIKVNGSVEITLETMTVVADLNLFAGTDDQITLAIRFVDNVLYVKIGDIALSFDIENDMPKLYGSIAKYIPDCFKSIGDLSAFTTITALINGLNELAAATDLQTVIDVLFATDNAYGSSMLKQIADMFALSANNGRITASITVMHVPFDVMINVQPNIIDDSLGFTLFTNEMLNLLSLDLTARLTFSDRAEPLNIPTANYTPLISFVTAMVNAVNTITDELPETVYTDSDGNTVTVKTTAFMADVFAFDYDIFRIATETDDDGNTVELIDETTGRKIIATDGNGNKIVDTHVDVANISGYPALLFKYETTTVTDVYGNATRSSKAYIEAHITLNIKEQDESGALTAKIGFPISIDLYVADGLAYVYYRESNGYGEKVSIDYDSILQIIAAFMDIVDADDETIDTLLGDHRLDIDTSVFDSMAIVGFDTIRDMINNTAKAVNDGMAAVSDVQAAIDKLYAAKDVDELIKQLLTGATDSGETTINGHITSALDNFKSAISHFQTESDDTDGTDPGSNAINGALFGKVVNAVSFLAEGDTVKAFIKNEIATGTEGTAEVAVESTADDKIDRITVDELDVNTAKLNVFELSFAFGDDLQDLNISIPSDYQATPSNTGYSDFGNIKHLLFDVMNTANMLEFEIGGFENTSDVINIHMSLGTDWLANIDITINYKAEVKIIKVGETNGKAEYKTAASIELRIQPSQLSVLGIDSKYILPGCTTRLFFYDDVIYISGIDDWTMSSENVYYKGKILFVKQYDKADVLTSASYVNVAYTVDELGYMMQNDMGRFLDEFVYYLIPITKEKILGQDIRGIIADNINGSSSGPNTQNTIAQIFKSYSYNGSVHEFVIGLAELAGSSSLSDLTITFTGHNDGDDNLMDNYIAGATVYTEIAKIITVRLNATLHNVSVDDTYYQDAEFEIPSENNAVTDHVRKELNPIPISTITFDYDKAIFTYNGIRYLRNGNSTNYVINDGDGNPYSPADTDCTYLTIEQIIDTVLARVTKDSHGNIVSVTNTTNGVQWSRPWKETYDAAQAAA